MENKKIATQGKGAMALAKIKTRWKKFGIDALDMTDGDGRPLAGKTELDQIRKEWDQVLNPWTEKTIKLAIANYETFHKHRELPPSLEDLQLQLRDFAPDQMLYPISADQEQRKFEFREAQKKRLTGLRRFGFDAWRRAALKKFFVDGDLFLPSWDVFVLSVSQVDSEVLQNLRRKIEQWNMPQTQRLADMLKAELADITQIINSERVI